MFLSAAARTNEIIENHLFGWEENEQKKKKRNFEMREEREKNHLKRNPYHVITYDAWPICSTARWTDLI